MGSARRLWRRCAAGPVPARLRRCAAAQWMTKHVKSAVAALVTQPVDEAGGLLSAPLAALPSRCAAPQHDAFVLVTFPETHTQLLDELLSKPLPGRSARRRQQQRFLAAVHNPYRLLSRKTAKRLVRNRALQPVSRAEWAGAARVPPSLSARPVPRLQLLSLAPATSEFAQTLVEQWALNTSGTAGHLYMPWLSPVAPWRPSFASVDIRRASSSLFAGANALRHVCIQASAGLAAAKPRGGSPVATAR